MRSIPVRLLDGGLSTALEQAGHDLSDNLWTARLLRDDPGAIVAAHRAYIDAGAEVVITAGYQASRQGFLVAGVSPTAADSLLRLPTRLAREAVAASGRHGVLVAASVGPYGAVLANGAEYTGDYGMSADELRAFHRARLATMSDATAPGPDIVAIETLPSATEALAIAAARRDLGHSDPCWVSFTCRSDAETADGSPIHAAVDAALSVPGIVAVGVNCTPASAITPLLAQLGRCTDLPLVAYPNGGGRWDPATNRWCDPGDGPTSARVIEWIDLGARFVGGCCGVGPSDIAALAAACHGTAARVCDDDGDGPTAKA